MSLRLVACRAGACSFVDLKTERLFSVEIEKDSALLTNESLLSCPVGSAAANLEMITLEKLLTLPVNSGTSAVGTPADLAIRGRGLATVGKPVELSAEYRVFGEDE